MAEIWVVLISSFGASALALMTGVLIWYGVIKTKLAAGETIDSDHEQRIRALEQAEAFQRGELNQRLLGIEREVKALRDERQRQSFGPGPGPGPGPVPGTNAGGKAGG